ncbi:hypothetical protein M011DRAFT_229081 [Sporormia fimetaria CBS 119925]|uniref:Uncharacterized protein n=1 Tax=Sporormia fimetaria CBS 119925 TaxID=1340428 RepID=A0A6A6VHF6_9PLEO|nr:hypothetical protein M011DRAFT_229081 [Sporormia fimetaria CBS 119925]
MAPRSPSRSSDGGSQHQVRAEPRLLKAIDSPDTSDDAIAIIEYAKAHKQPYDHLLRIGLQRAAERGNTYVAEYLLKNGAKADGAAGGRVSPLLKAVEKNHLSTVQLLLKHGDVNATHFRWIHLPANNLAWVEALLTKAFIEEGASDFEGFKALERSFNHQHRGQQIHSHFMRPLCQSTPRAHKNTEESDFSDGTADGPPQIVVNGSFGNTSAGAPEHPLPRMPTRTDTISTDQTDWTRGSSGSVPDRPKKEHGKSKEKPKKNAKWTGGHKGKSGGADTPTKHGDHNSRRKTSQSLTNSGHLRQPGSPGRKDTTSVAKGNIFAFMPYLHFESNKRRQEMQAAINRAELIRKHDAPVGQPQTHDEMLIRAHLTTSTVSLHVRRTLDQFFYHNIDTESRDEDQVVYRYQVKNQIKGKPSLHEGDLDPKIFMVDQLWMWTLGKDLIVTSFPQRWQQPKNDPLNVLDGIIEDINSKTREPVRSVYDLALLITGRCIAVLDRNRIDETSYQFLDMFEASIGDATEEETKLFGDFNIASAQASQWLQHHRRPNRFSRHLEAEGRIIEHQNKHAFSSHSHEHALSSQPIHEDDYRHGPAHAPLFVDKLLDIGAETNLLAETKDIRDELNMISKVLEDQRAVLPDLETAILELYKVENKPQSELKRRFRDQLKTIDTHMKDIDRMTIVTIVFLPLSFIAAMFTINIKEFPHAPDGSEPSLPLSYVAKYMFGIGLAISIPLVVVALKLDAIGDFFREMKRRAKSRKAKPDTHSLSTSPSWSSDHTLHSGSYRVNTVALEQALSAGRSVAGRMSYDSHYNYRGGASLLPVASRGTGNSAQNGYPRKVDVGMAARLQPPPPPERQSTGFRMRRSLDTEG